MNIGGRDVDLLQLQAELIAADISIRGLGRADDEVFTYTEDGEPIDLPSGAAAVLAAHEPSPPLPSDAAMIGEMIGSIEFGGDEASEELAAVMMALTSVLQARGF